MVDSQKILEENKRRNDILHAFYDPLTGQGSPVPRFRFPVDSDRVIYLPDSMKAIPEVQAVLQAGSVETYLKQFDELKENLPENISLWMGAINTIRLDHDFEYWAYTTVKVQDKMEKTIKSFRLRLPQRIILKELERMRLLSLPIRIILLKARQFGGSTLFQIYMAWFQLRLFENWHSAICADVESQARNIRGMFTRLSKFYPKDIGSITFVPYEGSTKVRVVSERGNIIGVGSMQSPDSLRAFDFAMLHLSEVGLWKTTEGKSPEDLVQTLRATVPTSAANTLIAMESTAKGVGNFFHREWLQAIDGTSGYRPVFIPWHKIEMYQRPIEDYGKFIQSMTDYQWSQWEKGATLEGIHWYQWYKQSENYDDWRMQSEFPTDWQEAFQSTGRRAFAPVYVARARKNCIPPVWVGDLFGDSAKGPDCLKNIRFEETKNGPLWLWAMPDSTPMKNRYGLFGDVGGRNPDADKSVLRVIDRYWMIDGGKPEIIATYRSNLDQDLFAWKAAQIGFWFNKGLLAIESNSLRKTESETEGDHFLTILDEIVNYYPNLFSRTDPDRIRQGLPARYGFHTNMSTKPMLIDRHNAAMRDEEYIERDHRACDEADTYEIKTNGSYGAVDGCHDDIEICTAGVVWLGLSYMDPCQEFRERGKVVRKIKRTEASL